ncbi:vitamin K epoxide reductase family protein [Dokdonia sp.]|uniref:vitamin K epoxide reductase family protein n=1 Tax=Dokdonia sp. TaxID=2024995 RepID=UPI0032674396
MEKLIISLLYSNHIYTVSTNDVHLQLVSHPEYPSVKSITDTLDYFGIENITANVPKDVLHQLPDNFLALIQQENEKQLVHISVKKKIHLKKADGKTIKQSREQFIQQWTGTIIAIEKNEKRELSSSFKTIKTEPLFFIVLLVSTLFLQIYLGTTWIVKGELFLCLLGMMAGYFITKEELGIKDKRITKLCSSLSKTGSDCGSLINSKELKGVRYIPFKTLVMVYFISLYLIVSILGFEVTILLSLSALSIPVVIASVYIQAITLKKWCLLCVVTSMILMAQFGLAITAFSGWDMTLSYLIFSAIIVIWTAIGWTQIKKLWKHKIEHQKVRQEYFRFKRNKTLFKQALHENAPIPTNDIISSYALTFGNENAAIKIVAITNPLCGYCSEPFETYARLITYYPNQVQISLVFNTPLDVKNKATEITMQVIRLYQQNKMLAWNALLDWYREKNVTSWTEKYPKKEEITANSTLEILTNYSGWCQQNNMNYTPETIINNRAFPKDPYQLSDLLFFIDDLILDAIESEVPVLEE